MNKGFSIKIDATETIVNSYISNSYDNFYFQSEKFDFLFEGLLLNKKKLLKEFALNDFETFIKEKYIQQKEHIINLFEGEFRGFIYNKVEDKIYIFTNATSTQRVFYTKMKDEFFADSSLHRLCETLKKFNIEVKPKIEIIYELISFGTILENRTLVEGVFKIYEGEYIEVNIKNLSINRYFYNNFNDISEYKFSKKRAIEDMHEIFSEAIKLEYSKDIELNSKHFSCLSGGLDSRISIFYGLKQGFTPETFCFSHSNYLDDKIAKKIAKDFHLKHQFVPLDGGEFLKNIDRLTKISDATNLYTGAIHVDFAMQSIDTDDIKIIHSGQVGGAILGSFVGSRKKIKPRVERILLNNLFMHQLSKETFSFFNNYESEELFLLRNSGFNKTVIGHQAMNQFAHQTSPFLYKDFIKLTHSIPSEWKFGSKFYLEWIKQFSPKVADYTWERTHLKPNAIWKTFVGDHFVRRANNIFYSKVLKKEYKNDMSPYQYYFEQSNDLKNYYSKYFIENIHQLDSYQELKNDIQYLFNKKDFFHKSQAVNILSIFKLYFSE